MTKLEKMAIDRIRQLSSETQQLCYTRPEEMGLCMINWKICDTTEFDDNRRDTN